MRIASSMTTFFNNLTDVPTTDPDDSRRRKILNVILIGMAAVAGFTAIATLILILAQAPGTEDSASILGPSAAAIVTCLIVYILNRYWSGFFASALFLAFLLIILSFADSPHELSNGRSIYLLGIPIIVASVLMGSRTTMIFWGLSSIQLIYLARVAGDATNIPAITSFFFLGLISWLSSRGLEQALKDLRKINAELDRRVEDRTRELSAALARELAEAGRNQAILEGIADGVVVFDPNGQSIVSNPSLAHLLELPVDKILGVSMETILEMGKISPQYRGVILSMLGNPSMGKSSVRLKWGQRTLLVNASQVISGMGTLIGTVAVFRDFTHEAEIEQMKSAFVGMVSHELRTPLNAIIGYAEMMRESVYGPIEQRQIGVLQRIENGSRRLLSLVSDLLDQAQIEAGRMTIHNADFQLSELVDSVRSQMEKQVQDKGLYLDIAMAPGMPAVFKGDSRRLQQIFLNLISNATKFTVKGGITVRVYNVNESRWGFSVADTGPGISLEAQSYVFESFRQVEGVATREHGGIGLGLAIVKSLVGLMGGEITLSSVVGQGTIFSVSLPIEPPKEKS